jgi:hypothetical protein
VSSAFATGGCYGLAFLWIGTLGDVRLGTLTPVLLLEVAAVWR